MGKRKIKKVVVDQTSSPQDIVNVAGQLFEGGGDMGRRMAAFDWDGTPLGPPAGWPRSLRVLVPLMLKSRQAMFIIWGEARTLLYNDRYAEVLARKHPAALAQPFDQVWSEIWETDLEALVGRAYGGESIHMDNIALLMERNGYSEVANFSFSYTPIRDGGDNVSGIFCPLNEITSQIREEARQRFRIELMDRLRGGSDSGLIMRDAIELLAHHLGASQAAFAEVDPDDEHVIIQQAWAREPEKCLSGRYRMDDFGPEVIGALRSGKVVAVPDVYRDQRIAGTVYEPAYRALEVTALLDVPLFQHGRMVGLIAVLSDSERHWNASEIALVQEVADNVWAMLQRARAENIERRRLEQLQILTETSVRVTAADGLDAAMDQIIEGARRVVEVHQAVVSLTAGEHWEQSINAVYLSDKYAEFAEYDAPPTGEGIYNLVCEENRALRMTQAELEAHPRFRNFSADVDVHPPMRGWLAAPLVGRDGQNLGLIQLSDKCDGTEFDQADEAILLQMAQLAAVAVEQARISDALRRSKDRSRLAIEAAQVGIWSFDVEKDELKCDSQCRKLFNLDTDRSTLPGDAFIEVLHPGDRGRVTAAVRAALTDPEGGIFDCEYRATGLNGDGDRWLKAKGRALFEKGRATRFTGTVMDITDRRRTEERQTLLAREIDHRAKNLLAVVQSVVQLTRADTTRDLKTALVGRIHALSKAHNLLAASQWAGVPLAQIVEGEFVPFRESLPHRIVVEGPQVQLMPAAGQSLALVLHELATNAAKYGAMSGDGGLLHVRWRLVGKAERDAQGAPIAKGALELTWCESEGPAIAPDRRDGFGTTMIKAMVQGQLGGVLDVNWAADGPEYRMVLPPEQIARGTVDPARPRGDEPARPVAMSETRLERILLVEDEALIALEMAAALEDSGMTVQGPFALVNEALAEIERARPDAAILDVNLAGERSYPIADRLRELGVPFAFCTGYASLQDLPGRFAAVPMLRKPISDNDLKAVLARLA